MSEARDIARIRRCLLAVVTMSKTLSHFRISLYALAKRLLDILAAALGLLVLSPFFAVVALAIKRDSPGPVFYHGQRAGRGGREFHILKFRSMYERPESHQGEKVTEEDNPPVTPVDGRS